MSAAIQTLWSELVVATLADAGVTTCVVSPGSRSTPLVAALVADGRFALPTIIDERAAAFFALGIARATGVPAAMVCTSGSAAAHYLPAIVEASEAGVPLIAITADRPPELQHCGAAQTIDQIELYGSFVRAAFDLGAPVASELALRAVRRTMLQAASAARGPRPGPVHVNVPLRKPLEPGAPTTTDELALARFVADLRGILSSNGRPMLAAPRIVADTSTIDMLAAAILGEPRGMIVAGAMHASFSSARAAVFEFARRTGYPILAEAGSQLRFASRPSDVVVIDHLDMLFAAPELGAPSPKLVIQIGAEPVFSAWSAAKSAFAGAARYVLGDRPADPDGTAHTIIVGDVATTFEQLVRRLDTIAPSDMRFASACRAADKRAGAATGAALAEHPRSEGAVLRAVFDALPAGTVVQIGNSLPIRVVDQVCGGGRDLTVITQRGAAGIDGLVASAAGATYAGKPVVLVLGDVSFAHDLGGLLATREARAPLAIVVVDNGGGRIFGGLPYAHAAPRAAFERHFTTAPSLDPSAIAAALGVRAVTAPSPAAVASAVASSLEVGVTVIHAPVAATGALDLRTTTLELLASASAQRLRGAHHG
jgi:2-succinyl-5-enolpyruvyl-6-hydroxy-3-cyclohexene-1-carboxylate synthase